MRSCNSALEHAKIWRREGREDQCVVDVDIDVDVQVEMEEEEHAYVDVEVEMVAAVSGSMEDVIPVWDIEAVDCRSNIKRKMML